MLALALASVATPAAALQTEVDPQEVAVKRAGLARWHRAEERRNVTPPQPATSASEALPSKGGPAEAPTTGIAGLIYDIFGSTGAAAVSVASCESGLDPNATNASSGAAGLFQLMPIHWEGRFDPYNAAANARYAFSLSSGGTDWSAWGCQP